MKHILRGFILFWVGGLAYYGIELLWRGYSHYTMLILGGFCFLLCGMLNENFKLKLWQQMIISAVIITVLEFLSGVLLNIVLDMGIWDYSNMPLNILGQVCLPFTFLWALLSIVIIKVDDLVRKIYNKMIDK